MGPTTPANIRALVWAVPVSLAATQGITIVFSSSGYLDVSVPRVSLPYGITGHDSSWVAPFGNPRISVCFDYPWLIADFYVLHRLLVPRHPPYALCNFAKSLLIMN